MGDIFNFSLAARANSVVTTPYLLELILVRSDCHHHLQVTRP